jgi:hypothetical protein
MTRTNWCEMDLNSLSKILLMILFVSFLGTMGMGTSVPLSDSITNLESDAHLPFSLDDKPSLTLTRELMDPPPIYWLAQPRNQLNDFGSSFEYQLAAYASAGIDQWWLNDTTHFAINNTGSITNASNLALGNYGLQIWVNDSLGNELTANFSVTVTSLIDWTVLVYLDGDNDLEENAFSDFNSMELVGSTTEVQILVLVDFWNGIDAPFTETRCYNITQDSDSNSINSIELATSLPSEANMGSANTLRDFVIFGQSYAPAERFLLVIWNHGDGCYGLCTDDTNHDFLSIRELNQALSDPVVYHLDIIAFDACLMGQLEVGYEIRNATDIVVFSEEGIPLTGFPYEDILNNLTQYSNTTPLQLAESVVYYYTTAYSVGGRYYDSQIDFACLSAVDTSYLESGAMHLNSLINELVSPLQTSTTVYELICLARRYTQGFASAEFMDLGGFATQLASVFSNQTGLSFTEIYHLALNLSTTVELAVIAESHLVGASGATGLGLTFGAYGYTQLALADDTSWDEFMSLLMNRGSSFYDAIQLEPYPEHYGYLDSCQDSVWFAFTPSAGGYHTFDMSAVWDDYVTDFDMYLYDSSGNELGASYSSESSESISQYLTAGVTYYIEVYSYGDDYLGAGVFQLAIYSPTSPTTPFDPRSSILIALIVIGSVGAIIVIVLLITYYVQRHPTSIAPPPRYAHPQGIPRHADPDVVRFCGYCGAVLPARAQYCPVCGASTKRD